MASSHDQEAGVAHRERTGFAEDSPLLRPMSANSAGSLCTCSVIALLALSWGVLDFSNRKVSDELFNIGDVRVLDSSKGFGQVTAPFEKFEYPLTLAFFQFVFMGKVFLCMYFVVTQQHPFELKGLSITSDKRWPSLVVSHVFSNFWLQSLMMPSQVMSLVFFAATRAFEIPAAALLRPPVLGQRFGKKTFQTTAFAFGASCLLYFAYSQLAGCLCILSGNGVALTGLAFWVIYALVLAMPAFNAVYQESVMLDPGMHPLLVLALQNIFASLLFGPVLLIAHMLGWENVGSAFYMILSHQEVFMLVGWLCAQVALTSLACTMLIRVADSFWAIALRPIRVVFWGTATLMHFYLTSDFTMSVRSPRSSWWSFVIVSGCCLAVAAMYTDQKAEDNSCVEKPTDAGNAKDIRI
jgi:hypothetical protein